ncbi:MAG TPA: hypothetical protein VIX12_07615 [Candidatus Binataceae bacterium]
MKHRAPALVFLGLIIVIPSMLPSQSKAIEQPRIIPRSAQINQPVDEVFKSLKTYFSDSALSMFQLVSAEAASKTIVARRNGIDDGTWAKWAFCETGPVEMIYKLQDGAVTVTVKLEPSGKNATFAKIMADFQGTYALYDRENKVACSSTGALEGNILAAAGAPPSSTTAH